MGLVKAEFPKWLERTKMDLRKVAYKEVKTKNWLYKHMPNVFRFYIEIPFVSIEIEALTKAYERLEYIVLAFRIRIWKWSINFRLGETKEHAEDR